MTRLIVQVNLTLACGRVCSLSAQCYANSEEDKHRCNKVGSREWLWSLSQWGVSRWLTILDKATLSLGTIRAMSKVALMAGSSQQGKALRASVAWRRGTREDKGTEFCPIRVFVTGWVIKEHSFGKIREQRAAWLLAINTVIFSRYVFMHLTQLALPVQKRDLLSR